MSRSDAENAKKLRELGADIVGYENLSKIIEHYSSGYCDLEPKLTVTLAGDHIEWEAFVEIYDRGDHTETTASLVSEHGHSSFSVAGTDMDAVIDELAEMWRLAKENHVRWLAAEQQRNAEIAAKNAAERAELEARKAVVLAKLTDEDRKILGM